MADLKFDTLTKDIALSDGDFAMVYDDAAIEQSMNLRLNVVKGEWFLDQNAGTDWFDSILGKQSVLTQRAELRRRILGTDGIADLEQLDFSLDKKTRKLSAVMVCRTEAGRALEVRFNGGIGA